jgi:hypothetical protein
VETKQNEKISKFMKKYEELTKECGVDMVAYPMFVPNSDGSFKVIIQTQPIDLAEQEKAKRESFIAKNV